jgi:hypothetical protein
MTTMSINLHKLEGFDYEQAYMEEVGNFKNAAKGVDGYDVAAALILIDQGETNLLERLRRREIHCIVSVDEDSTFQELEFE